MLANTHRKPTAAEKSVIAQYADYCQTRGFYRIDVAGRGTQLFNRFANDRDAIRSLDYLTEDFDDWLHQHRLECDFQSAQYIAKRLTLIVGSLFVPGGQEIYQDERNGFRYANTYRNYRPSGTSSDVSPLLIEFFERLVPDKQERTIFLQWIAHIFQRPAARPSWHILMPSDPGIGKGFLVEHILHPLLHHTMVARSFENIMGKFSSALESNLLILLDDCKSKSDSTQTQLKSILSEERQYIEKKNQQGAMVPTYARCILASNEARPLYLEADDRRWFVLSRMTHRVDREETQAFIAKLEEWLKLPGSLCKVYNWFMSIDLTGFKPKAVPQSGGLAAIVAMSKSPHLTFLESYVDEHSVFRYADLKEALKQEGMNPPSDAQLPHLLRDIGYESSRPRLKSVGGNKVSVCHPVGMSKEDIDAALSVEEVVNF